MEGCLQAVSQCGKTQPTLGGPKLYMSKHEKQNKTHTDKQVSMHATSEHACNHPLFVPVVDVM